MKKEESFKKYIYKNNISDKENLIHKKNYNVIDKLRNIKNLPKIKKFDSIFHQN